MKIGSVASVKARFSEYLKSSQDGPVIITRNGKPVAVLLSVTDEDEIERLLIAYSPKLRKVLNLAEKQIREGNSVDHERFWEDIESMNLSSS
ncbi:MAG: type II toxin-antitoxin system Phd/YefM family antitoxin [Bellilinea sp.]